MSTITNPVNKDMKFFRPEGKKEWALAGLSCASFLYSSSLGLATRIGYLGYKCLSWRWRVNVEQSNIVEKNLSTELFKRLPIGLKNGALKKYSEGGVTSEELAHLQQPPTTWTNRKVIRELAIQASLEEKISKEILSFVMLHTMIAEARHSLPTAGIKFRSSCAQSREEARVLFAPFCEWHRVDVDRFLDILGNFSSREDAFFVVDMNKQMANGEFHYTAALSRELYPFSIENDVKKRLFVFQPHIFEKVVQALYPEFPERPLAVLGTKKIEKFSDNTQRVLSMTGGTTLPTPNIEANEALSFPFYLHDCYHIEIDCAMGQDRVFWNAFGKDLKEFANQQKNPDLQVVFQTLSEFCLDKEFQNYRDLPKDLAVVIPFIGMYEIAGKQATNNQDKQFQPINSDPHFLNHVRSLFLHRIEIFWRDKVPHLPLPAALLNGDFIKSLPQLKDILSQSGESLPEDLEKCLIFSAR